MNPNKTYANKTPAGKAGPPPAKKIKYVILEQFRNHGAHGKTIFIKLFRGIDDPNDDDFGDEPDEAFMFADADADDLIGQVRFKKKTKILTQTHYNNKFMSHPSIGS